jgi:OHCU decarboxylase
MAQKHSISQINLLACDEFTQLFGPVFEHSPWIAEETWATRPFTGAEDLHRRLRETVLRSGREKQIALIRAHPDLVGQAALAGSLTAASNSEQASASLNRLTPNEVAAFEAFNQSYRDKFGFPFVICARLNKKEAILAGFEARLNNSREVEIQTALEEIFKIARLRLEDIL